MIYDYTLGLKLQPKYKRKRLNFNSVFGVIVI